MTRAIQRQRKERRSIPPFGDGADPNAISNVLEGLLAKCRFSPFQDKKLDNNDSYFLSPDEVVRSIEPRFEIVVDRTDELSNRLGLQEADIDVGLSVRSTHLRRYEVLQRWSGNSVPFEPWSPNPAMLTRLQSDRGMDFILAVRVVADRKKLTRQGLSRGKVLCRKVFSVKQSIDSFSFPFQWARFGGETDYPEESLWVLKWIYNDDENNFARPVDQLLTVLVNEKAEAPLSAMNEVQLADDLAWRMLAADITTQIWADVLSNIDEEPDEDDTETLAGQVFARLSSISGMPYAEIKGLVKQDDSLMELRNLVARILRVVG